MNVRFVNYGLQYKKYKKELDRAIFGCINRGQLVLRDELEQFEKELAKYVGTRHAVGLNSGTDALFLALWALGVGKGDEILVPAYTFVATAQVVNQLGAKPILYDRDLNISFLVNKKTKGIIPAHIAGNFEGDMKSAIALAKKHKLFVLEDACQALGAVQGSKKAGAWGLAGAFSFYPAKILGALGDAGALVTNDKKLYEKVKELRNHCKGDTKEWGINSRLDNIQAAILRVKLRHLPEILKTRRRVAEQYLEELDGVVGLPENTNGRVWQDFIIHTEKRNELYEYLKKHGIETMKNEYPMPLKKLPIAGKYESETLRIPCNDVLTKTEVNYVIKTIKRFFK